MASLILRQLTAGTVAFTTWRLSDGSLHESRISQAAYDDFAINRKGVGDAPGRPDPGAVFLLAAGGVPALNTATGWPSLGDCWVVDDGKGGQALVVCAGDGNDWAYRRGIASVPDVSRRSRLLGIACEVRGNRFSIPAGGYSVDRQGRVSITAPLPSGVTVASRELTVDSSVVASRVTIVDEDVPNHRSVTFDAATSGVADPASSITISHTVANQTDRYLAGLTVTRSGQSVSSVTFNGTNLTQRIDIDSTVGTRSHFWDLVAPTVTTANAVFTFSASTSAVGGVISAYGVDQTTPRNDTDTDVSAPISLSLASATDGLCISITGYEAGTTPTLDSDWTSLWNTLNAGSGNDRGSAGGYITGAATITRDDTFTGTPSVAAIGVALSASAPAAVYGPALALLGVGW